MLVAPLNTNSFCCSPIDYPNFIDCVDLGVIEEVYRNELATIYERHQCATNTLRFLQKIRERPAITPIEFSQLRVLFLHHRDKVMNYNVENGDYYSNEYSIHPQKTADGETRSWAFHVVLVVGNRVFDSDFKGQQGLPRDDYLRQMFGDEASLLCQFELSAQEYLGDLNTVLTRPDDTLLYRLPFQLINHFIF